MIKITLLLTPEEAAKLKEQLEMRDEGGEEGWRSNLLVGLWDKVVTAPLIHESTEAWPNDRGRSTWWGTRRIRFGIQRFANGQRCYILHLGFHLVVKWWKRA